MVFVPAGSCEWQQRQEDERALIAKVTRSIRPPGLYRHASFDQLRPAREFMGEDFWSYGLEPNRKQLDTFLRYHHKDGLSSRPVNFTIG